MAMTPSALTTLLGLPRLKHLRIQQCQLLDQQRSVSVLVIKPQSFVSILRISQKRGLVELHLYKCQFAESLSVISNIKDVKSLNLRGSFLTDADFAGSDFFIRVFGFLSSLPFLMIFSPFQDSDSRATQRVRLLSAH